MDPFTWIGAISGVLQIAQVISQTTAGLVKLKGRFSNADLTIQSLIGELSIIESALTHLEDWAKFNARGPTKSEEYIEGLNVALDGCRAVMEVLSEEVASLVQNIAGQDSVVGFRARVKVVWNEDVMRGHQERLHAQVVALQLLLQACQCRSSSEQVELLRRAENRQIIKKVADDTATLRGSSYAGSHAHGSSWSFYQPSVSNAASDLDRVLAPSPSIRYADQHFRSKSDIDEGYASAATTSRSYSQTGGFSVPLRPNDSIVLRNGHSTSVTLQHAPRQYSQSQVRRSQSDSNPPSSARPPLGSKREKIRSVLRQFSRSSLTSSSSRSPGLSPTASRVARPVDEKDLKTSIDLTTPEGATAPLIVKLAQSGGLADIEMLIESGHGVETRHLSTRRTALLVAAHCGNEAVVNLLIQKNARLDAVDAWGSTALHLAASRGHFDVLQLLLLEQLDPEARDARGRTALWLAAGRGQLEATRLLIAHHAKVNVRAENHTTPLHAAAKRGDEAIVELLISCGADLEARDGAMMTALHYACEEGHLGVMKLLLDNKANINTLGSDRRTPLICAAAMGRFLVAQELLRRKASTQCVDDASMTAVHWAAFNGHTEIVDLLSQKKGVLAATNKLGRTALHLAAMNSRFAVIELLVRRGVPVDTRCQDGLTPLHYACLANSLEISRLLLISNANIEAQTEIDQRRPIHIAAARGSMNMLNLLCDKGASLEARDAKGDRALGVACRHGHAAAVQNLLGRGCPLYLAYETRPQEDSPLCLAAMGGHLAVVSLLLQHGASVVRKDESGWQPHHYAAYHGHPDVLALLLQRGPASANDGTSFGLDAAGIGFAPHAIISEERKEQVRRLLHRDSRQLAAQAQISAFQPPPAVGGTLHGTAIAPQLSLTIRSPEPCAEPSAMAPQELPVTLEQGLPPSRSATPEHMRGGRRTSIGRAARQLEPSVSYTGATSEPWFDYSLPYWRGSPVSAVRETETEVEVLAPQPSRGTTSEVPVLSTFDSVDPGCRYVVEDVDSYYGPEYTCTICRSQFDYLSEVAEHCQWDHFWCGRCERVFVSEASKRDHLRNSHRHHICHLCEFEVDFPSQRDLEDHLDEQHCLCEPCRRYFPSAYELGQHDIQCHNWCNICDRYFSNENNYRMHQRSHDARDEECFGCYRAFGSFSAMLIHLEAGNCAKGVGLSDIHEMAFECYQAQ
ncbi:ankyrin repeat protein [Aspergillus thermomutatus]|uniref:C2H2-type domain-containing protein n=1 Tax=Aspergillus thermomutatus TaxID=41047 RepID=A0A397GCS2_ASPTH|nr:uncharacterized protein CDV56_101460 [Aspergillus thermomutatus]RHZ47654.1 hypothetical protein CDV56_101460 [Aspergillus thermomutatus]